VRLWKRRAKPKEKVFEVGYKCSNCGEVEPGAEGDWVKVQDALDREAVLQAQIRTLEVQLKDALARLDASLQPTTRQALTDKRDAARYRWLKAQKEQFDLMGRHSYYATKLWSTLGRQQDWDLTIDNARAINGDSQ
jgi:hypothetical protein